MFHLFKIKFKKKSAPEVVTPVTAATVETYPLSTSLHSHPLRGLQHLLNVYEHYHWVHFSAWRISVTNFIFISSFTSDTILSDCPSAAVCHMAKKCNGIFVGVQLQWEVQLLLSYHQHPPLMLWANIIKKELLLKQPS